ncbi:hypothetical protein [Streptomyces sp. NPDC088258]|uniref:hypothetical protein n=1 Tax=Streptomyces sp. NPDC088258 TaxID=3365849 RepID=UPI003814E66D
MTPFLLGHSALPALGAGHRQPSWLVVAAAEGREPTRVAVLRAAVGLAQRARLSGRGTTADDPAVRTGR